MQISTNTTCMEAGLTVATESDGRQRCVAVIKGTFSVAPDGSTRLTEVQQPMVYADIHYGDPAATSIQYGCDFSPDKPFVDVLVRGHAHAPRGRPTTRVKVVLAVGSLIKEAFVQGDRIWRRGILGTISATPPQPFTIMPLRWEHAFGGTDDSHADVARHRTEMRNLVGRGFRVNSDSGAINDTPLPNIESTRDELRTWSDRPPPVGFGIVGRSWQPRISYAGTYDQRWLDERFPFLPSDFDPRYHQLAPLDQWLPVLAGGEVIQCLNMTDGGTFVATVPRIAVPVCFQFRDRKQECHARLDTLLVEPEEQRLIMTWRASVLLGAKIHALHEVLIGKPSAQRITVDMPPSRLTGLAKPHFASLGDYIAWRRKWIPR